MVKPDNIDPTTKYDEYMFSVFLFYFANYLSKAT